MDVSKRRIQKIVYKFKSESKYWDRKRVGRPPKLSKRLHSIIRRQCLKNRRKSLRNIARNYNMGSTLHVSRCTFNRILNKYGLRSHPAVCKPLVNDKQRKRRLQWARSGQQWDINKWSHVTSLCFEHIIIVILKEFGGFKMKGLVLFALRRLFNMVHKCMSTQVHITA